MTLGNPVVVGTGWSNAVVPKRSRGKCEVGGALTPRCFIQCYFCHPAWIISAVMVRGKAFMLSPWSNAFDTLGRHPPHSRDPKDERSRRGFLKKQTPKGAATPVKILFAVWGCALRVFKDTHTLGSYALWCIFMCVLASQSGKWSVKSGLFFVGLSFQSDSSLLLLYVTSRPSAEAPPLYYSPSHWPCYRPFHTTLLHHFLPFCLSLSVFLPRLSFFSSLSLTLPLIIPFLGAVVCN